MFSRDYDASAPGKLILFGEHAVVYGSLAVAGSLHDLRVTATARLLPEAAGEPHIIRISMPPLASPGDQSNTELAEEGGDSGAEGAAPAQACGGVSRVDASRPPVAFSLQADRVLAAFPDALDSPAAAADPAHPPAAAATLRARAPPFRPTAEAVDTLEVLVRRGAAGRAGSGADDRDLRRAAVSVAFLAAGVLRAHIGAHLAASAATEPVGGVEVSLQVPTLPVGVGLGSSAALSVAVAGALLRAASAACTSAAALAADSQPADVGGWCRPSEPMVELVNDWAFAAECIYHGTPSGLDNTASAHGGAILFRKVPRLMRPLHDLPPLDVLVVNTTVPKDTHRQVAHVRSRRSESPEAIDELVHDIDGVVREAVTALAGPAALEGVESLDIEGGMTAVVHRERRQVAAGAAAGKELADAGAVGAAGAAAGEVVEVIGGLMRRNHTLLNRLEVGHGALDRVVEVCAEHAVAAKLTGAGGGGCALALLSPRMQSDPSAAEALLGALQREGFVCFRTRLGGDGLITRSQRRCDS